MTTDWKALCAELVAWAEKTSSNYYKQADVLLRARVALADGPAVPEGREPASVALQPSDEDLWTMYDEMRGEPGDWAWVRDFARAVLARWGNPAPQPVPVSERLPGPEDCDAEDYCWRWNTIGGLWARQPLARSWYEFESHWLSAHALPLPKQEVSE